MEHEQLVRKAREGDEPFAKRPGLHLSRAEALRGCREALDGLHGDLPVDAFYFTGSIDDIRKGRRFGLNNTDYPDTTGDRRARMIAGFNHGHNGLQQTTRICAPAASVAIGRDLDAGSKISLDRTARDANELASHRLGVSC